MSDERKFELAEEDAEPAAAPPPPRPSAPTPTPARGAQKLREREAADAYLGLVGPKRKRRLLRYVPMWGIGFGLAGFASTDQGLLYLVLGLLLGVFAGWARRGEIVTTIAATVVAVGTPFAGAALGHAMQLSLFGIVAFVVLGYLFGLDDRLNTGA